MNVPVGFLAKLWSLASFLPFFVLLLLLGSAKALLIGPVAAAIVFLGDSAVIVGLWPAHFVWTYCCVLAYADLLSPHFSFGFLFFAVRLPPCIMMNHV
ncbi:unnamed protein product [Triticum turgidum subsp. durum]|uniref:Uncharacterized protein n=1 Tax=Triticum turgidum subsp. durum TaxID=4567 RepID=A0A9R0Z8C7_TRITD|nr:unnamed protein product [Triticum turgidum subsp. durum]